MMQETNTTTREQLLYVQDLVDVRRAFITALLLTGRVEQAEDAVIEAIGQFDTEQSTAEQLLTLTVAAAIKKSHAIPQSSEVVMNRSSILPWELNSVTYLSPYLRHCYVLRILLGWSREISARFLQLETGQLDEHTQAAAARLTYIHKVFRSAANHVPGPPLTNGFSCLGVNGEGNRINRL
jgi:hypothetical protein